MVFQMSPNKFVLKYIWLFKITSDISSSFISRSHFIPLKMSRCTLYFVMPWMTTFVCLPHLFIAFLRAGSVAFWYSSTSSSPILGKYYVAYELYFLKSTESSFILCTNIPKSDNTIPYSLESSVLMKVKVKVAQLCQTLRDPMDYTVHRIL